MNTNSAFPANETVFELAGDWKADVLNLIKKELELAKTELSEKASCIGRNSVFIGIGGACGLMAVLLLFLGLGSLIAFALRAVGMSVSERMAGDATTSEVRYFILSRWVSAKTFACLARNTATSRAE